MDLAGRRAPPRLGGSEGPPGPGWRPCRPAGPWAGHALCTQRGAGPARPWRGGPARSGTRTHGGPRAVSGPLDDEGREARRPACCEPVSRSRLGRQGGAGRATPHAHLIQRNLAGAGAWGGAAPLTHTNTHLAPPHTQNTHDLDTRLGRVCLCVSKTCVFVCGPATGRSVSGQGRPGYPSALHVAKPVRRCGAHGLARPTVEQGRGGGGVTARFFFLHTRARTHTLALSLAGLRATTPLAAWAGVHTMGRVLARLAGPGRWLCSPPHIHKHLHTHIHTHTCTHAHARAHERARARTHTHTHTHTNGCSRGRDRPP